MIWGPRLKKQKFGATYRLPKVFEKFLFNPIKKLHLHSKKDHSNTVRHWRERYVNGLQRLDQRPQLQQPYASPPHSLEYISQGRMDIWTPQIFTGIYREPHAFYRVCTCNPVKSIYHKVVSNNTSCLEAHSGFFRLSIKGKFDVYLLWPFGEKLIS